MAGLAAGAEHATLMTPGDWGGAGGGPGPRGSGRAHQVPGRTRLQALFARPQSCHGPRAGGTGRPAGRARPWSLQLQDRAGVPGLKQGLAPRGLQARGGSRAGQATHPLLQAWDPPASFWPSSSPLSASAPSTAASLRVQVPLCSQDTSHWPGAALTASTSVTTASLYFHVVSPAVTGRRLRHTSGETQVHGPPAPPSSRTSAGFSPRPPAVVDHRPTLLIGNASPGLGLQVPGGTFVRDHLEHQWGGDS